MSGFFLKSAGSQIDHAIDWRMRHLREGETIVTDEGWSLVPDLGELSVVSSAHQGDRTVVTLDGGAPGKVYIVTGTVITSSGRRLTDSAALRVSGEA